MDQDNEKDYLGRQYAPSSPDMADLYPAGLYPAGPNEARTNAARSDAGPHVTGPGEDLPVPADPASDRASGGSGHVRQVRVATVVWGLVLTVLAVLLLLANTVNLSVDPVLLVLCLTLGAGLALLAGGFMAAAGRRRKRS